MSFVMIVELLIVLAALYVGSRYGSLALGAISGIGLAILVFGFGLTPGTPPTDVIYIIIAAVTCAGTLQASGGMDWMIQIAERLLRKHPEHITFLGPLVTFFLTVLVGTGHVVYTIMPIICDIALKKGIRPERPCGVASVASQVGITCSPIAAAVVAFVTISNANGYMVAIPQVLMVTIPACVLGLMCAALASYKRGKDLDKDPDFLKRKSDPEQYAYMYGSTATTLDKVITPQAKASVFIFLGSLLVIVAFAFLQIKFIDTAIDPEPMVLLILSAGVNRIGNILTVKSKVDTQFQNSHIIQMICNIKSVKRYYDIYSLCYGVPAYISLLYGDDIKITFTDDIQFCHAFLVKVGKLACRREKRKSSCHGLQVMALNISYISNRYTYHLIRQAVFFR